MVFLSKAYISYVFHCFQVQDDCPVDICIHKKGNSHLQLLLSC